MVQSFDQSRPATATSALSSELRDNFKGIASHQSGASRPNEAIDGSAWWDTVRYRLNLYITGHTYSSLGVVRVREVGRYQEDFFGAALDPRWVSTTPVGSSISFPSATQTIVRLNTTGSVTCVTRHSAKQMQFGLHQPYFAVRVRPVTLENRFEIGLENDTTTFIGFIGGTHTNYHLRVTDGSTTTEVDTGVAIDANFHWLRLVTGTMTVAQVDDGNNIIVTSPAPTTTYLGFKAQMAGLTTAAKTFDLDYLEEEYLRS